MNIYKLLLGEKQYQIYLNLNAALENAKEYLQTGILFKNPLEEIYKEIKHNISYNKIGKRIFKAFEDAGVEADPVFYIYNVIDDMILAHIQSGNYSVYTTLDFEGQSLVEMQKKCQLKLKELYPEIYTE